LAVHDEDVAVAHRTSLEAGEVRAGAGLGIALTPPDVAAHDGRQVLPLLLLGADVEEQRSDHGEAEADERRAEAERRHLLRQHFSLRFREPAPAIRPRPGGRRPAALGHDREPACDVWRVARLAAAPAEVLARAERLAHRG